MTALQIVQVSLQSQYITMNVIITLLPHCVTILNKSINKVLALHSWPSRSHIAKGCFSVFGYFIVIQYE